MGGAAAVEGQNFGFIEKSGAFFGRRHVIAGDKMSADAAADRRAARTVKSEILHFAFADQVQNVLKDGDVRFVDPVSRTVLGDMRRADDGVVVQLVG